MHEDRYAIHHAARPETEEPALKGARRDARRKKQRRRKALNALCVECKQRKAVCKTPSGICKRKDHPLCFKCYRALVNSRAAGKVRRGGRK